MTDADVQHSGNDAAAQRFNPPATHKVRGASQNMITVPVISVALPADRHRRQL